MPSFEFATIPVALPAWAAGAVVALFVVVGVLALTRTGAGVAGAILRVAVIIAGFAAVWLLLEQGAQRERSADRRALDQRAAELAARAVAPGSPLACLDAAAGDAVETACEKAVFASPASVAAAVSYVTARLALLADMVDFARRSGERYETALATLRLALETDRYGMVAHVLSVRDSCTPLLCDSYVLLHDPDRVQANLRDRLFDRYVERYTAEWAAHRAGDRRRRSPRRRPPTRTAAGMPPVPVAGPSAMRALEVRFSLGRLDPSGQHHDGRAGRAARSEDDGHDRGAKAAPAAAPPPRGARTRRVRRARAATGRAAAAASRRQPPTVDGLAARRCIEACGSAKSWYANG